MIPFLRYLMLIFTLFNGFGFKSGKKEKRERSSESQQLSCSAPNRLPSSQTKRKSTEKINEKGYLTVSGAEEANGSPASKTQPIAIQSTKPRSATLRSRTGGSAYSLHSTTSAGSAGSRRIGHGHGTPHSGGRSAIGNFFAGSAGSPVGSGHSGTPRSTPQSYSKSHEAVWEQAYRNSCR